MKDASAQMTATGDAWREFALAGAKFVKDKKSADYAGLAAALNACAEREEKTFRFLLDTATA